MQGELERKAHGEILLHFPRASICKPHMERECELVHTHFVTGNLDRMYCKMLYYRITDNSLIFSLSKMI